MNVFTLQLLEGVIFALVIVGAGWAIGVLSFSGAIAAWILGALVFSCGGWQSSVIIIAFFISSSLLSSLLSEQKKRVSEKFSKGHRRDAAQVIANGGLAGVMILFHCLWPQALFPWLGYAVTLAAATADTWATEIGVLSKTPPRILFSGKSAVPGDSGAVSSLGLASAFYGSLFISGLGLIFWPETVVVTSFFEKVLWIAAICLAGFTGSLVDSWVGSTLQAVYYCSICQKETEQTPLHSCGAPTRQLRGWNIMQNDAVNVICTMSAVLFIFVLWGMITW